MFIAFTYKCPACGHTEDRFVRRSEMDVQVCTRNKAMRLMTRLPAGTRTTFKFADGRLKR